MVEGLTERQRVGALVRHPTAAGALALIRQAEAAGVTTAWMTMTATALDTPTLFAAAAVETAAISLGTAIVPAFTRHPLALATQGLVLGELAPGRVRLGIGTSHGPAMTSAYGLAFQHPLAQLREYLQVLRTALHDGHVTFAGAYYQVDARLPAASPIPILISALREHAFELAGELSDGAISWLCPPDYLINLAKPAMQRGAERAGHTAPPLVANTMVAFSSDQDAVRAAARARLGLYGRLPFYARMFAASGYPVDAAGTLSDALIDQLVISGDDAAIAAGLRHLLARGLDELLVGLIPLPGERGGEEHLFRLVGRL